MKKESITCFITLLFFSAYSQHHSILPVEGEMLSMDSVQSAQQFVPELKMNLDHERNIYTIKGIVDIPIVVAGTTLSLYNLSQIEIKEPSSEEQILSLDKKDINGFDRWAVYPYDQALDEASYIPYYASMVYPFVFFLADKEMKKDYGKLSFLYWEMMAVMGIFGTSATNFVDKYRPYAYHPETPMDKRIFGHAKSSFYAGHVQVVTGPLFFMAKVYSDYHPESNTKWIHYGVATAATATMAYMRLQSGEHFPSDILLGIGMGIAAGTLVPQFHKTRIIKNPDMSLVPIFSDDCKGLAFLYRIN